MNDNEYNIFQMTNLCRIKYFIINPLNANPSLDIVIMHQGLNLNMTIIRIRDE